MLTAWFELHLVHEILYANFIEDAIRVDKEDE